MAALTQDMRYRLSLIKYAQTYGVTKAAVKYKTNRPYIYRWKRRYDGSWDSLGDLISPRALSDEKRLTRRCVIICSQCNTCLTNLKP